MPYTDHDMHMSPLGPPSHDTAETIGDRIAKLRKQRGITQVELARRLGIAQSLISQYEHEVIRVSATLLAQIAQALEASADEILGLSPPTNGRPQPLRIARRVHRILDLPARDQQAILRTIDAFLDRSEAKKKRAARAQGSRARRSRGPSRSRPPSRARR